MLIPLRTFLACRAAAERGSMIASTCLAVLFVPLLFVIVQRFEEWQASRKARPQDAPAE